MVATAFVLNVAALFTLASALSRSPLYGCLLETKRADQGYTCPDSVYPFHLLCGPASANEAAEACSAQGWRLAVLNDYNKFQALYQIRNCTPLNAWVESFNGVTGNGCFQFRGDAPVIETDLSHRYCREAQQAILCEEIPVETITETSYISTTTVEDVKTKTKKVHPTCPHRHCKPCKPHHHDSEFVILDEKMPFRQAECACKQLDMKLADLNIDNFLDASYELWNELGASKRSWIHSWNGDKYSYDTCLALWTGSSGPNGAIAQPHSCHEHLSVLCQRHHRPPCPCKPQQDDCNCYRKPRHHDRHHKGASAEEPVKSAPAKPEKRVFLQSEPLPIFSSAQEKAVYDEQVAALRKQQQQDKAKQTNEKVKVGEQVVAEQEKEEDDDEGLMDPEAEKCIHGSGHCPKVCKYRTEGIRIVKTNATAYEAEEVCRRFGWSLLDYNDHHQAKKVRYLKKKCCGGAQDELWIRSYNGVDGGACMFIDGGYGVPVAWVLSADDCVSMGGRNVLCQCKDKPVYTSTGTFIGDITYTTETEFNTLTTTTFTGTVTTTVTLLRD